MGRLSDVFHFAGLSEFPFRCWSRFSSLYWLKFLDNSIFPLSWRSSGWSFPISWIPLNNCTGPPIINELCEESGLTEQKKAWWKLHTNATRYFEQSLEATSHETTAVWPLTSYLKNHPSKTKKTYGTLFEKQGRTYKWHSSIDSYIWSCQWWPTSKKIIYISSVRTQDVVWKTCREWWMIGT